ncbi:MAG: dihydropteroate synthase, partial [Polyangiaceae bacterium]|nr:dihydropteroate synthase [Polyangiaceae bacterium]
SFSDGGRFLDDASALAAAELMLADGAVIIDVGAESTRPNAPAIPAAEQIARIGSIVERLVERGALVSIDTTDPEVAAFAVGQGATLINCVDLRAAGPLAAVASRAGVMRALMHSRGSMTTMAGFSRADERAYEDVDRDDAREWTAAKDVAVARGLPETDVILDPGLGFHKSARHSLELCARLEELVGLGHPVLVGSSRKSFLAVVTTAPGRDLPPPDGRLGGTIASCLVCAEKGAAILRVHDVAEVRQALAFAEQTRLVERGAKRA